MTYSELIQNPPKLEVKENPTQVIINLVSCMCNNKYTLILEKDSKNLFRLNSGRFAYTNFGIPAKKYDLEFLADVSEWDEIFNFINQGTVKIESVRSR